jgi:hypothetical protein
VDIEEVVLRSIPLSDWEKKMLERRTDALAEVRVKGG